MKKLITLTFTITLTIALFCSGCGNSEPDGNETEQAEKNVSEQSETAETAETEENIAMNKISAVRWDDMSNDFSLDVMLRNEQDYYGYGSGYDYDISDSENIKKICERNGNYLTGKGKYTDEEGIVRDAVYYFKNNNAYVLYDVVHIIDNYGSEDEQATRLCLRNRMICDLIDFDETGEYIVKVPFPVYVDILDYNVRLCWEEDEKWDEKHLFSLCTFNEAKEFYSMFSDGTALVDEESEVIRVRGTLSSEKTNDNKPIWAVLDFKDKTYEVQNEDGSFLHSCKTVYDRIEKEYISAGTIDGKEVIYDLGNNIIIKENGKRRILMGGFELEDFLDDNIPGYSCVCKDCVLKLIKIKGNKYYFNVKATMEEPVFDVNATMEELVNQTWTVDDTLLIEESD